MANTAIRTAFVSTNSITQGEQVAGVWKPLYDRFGIHIDFAHRTFRWDSEASLKAHVHCVIVGFSSAPNKAEKRLFDNDSVKQVGNINPFLIDSPTVFVESITKPICNVPSFGIGNMPIDNGNYLFTKEEMNDFISVEPLSEKYFHPWYDSRGFINNKRKYCLWLGNCSPTELKRMPKCLERIENVRTFRAASKRASTLKYADYPTRFPTENMPSTNYLVVPEVSSQRRRYLPIGFMTPDILCSNKLRLMPNGSTYHFGILESNVHMAWMRAICGRLKSDYDYSIAVVYNNFPWPSPSPEQKAKIEQTAQGILDARALYPDSSLADLYDPLTMPPELRKAHDRNNVAVMKAYGFPTSMSEADCVAALMKMYQELTSE